MGEYIHVGGVKTWYEEWGQGEPVVLLHGDFATIETWSLQVPALAERYHVIAPERRGHGRTPDPGPISYELWTQDTIAFLEAKIGEPAHLVGWSGGANVAIMVANRRPDLVRKLVILSTIMNDDGYVPEVRAAPELTIDGIPDLLRKPYEEVSPDGPEHFPVVFEKLMRMWREELNQPIEDLAPLSMPTLVVVGDDDVVSLEHAIEQYRILPNSQLAVVPGTSHALPLEKPDIVNCILLDFLASEHVEKLMAPARREETG